MKKNFTRLFADDSNYDQLKPLLHKYFAYSREGARGYIPQAMGEIVRMSDRYVGPKELKITHQRYRITADAVTGVYGDDE